MLPQPAVIARMGADEPLEYLSPQQLAAALGYSVATLKRWRDEQAGPAWSRCGYRGVRYRRADVEAWLEAQRMAPPARGPRSRTHVKT